VNGRIDFCMNIGVSFLARYHVIYEKRMCAKTK
jgi:hypothetical protein